MPQKCREPGGPERKGSGSHQNHCAEPEPYRCPIRTGPDHRAKRKSRGWHADGGNAIACQADSDVMRNYVQGLINLLDEVKCRLPDPEQWDTKLNRAYDKATRRSGRHVRFQKETPGGCGRTTLYNCFEHRLMGLRCQS